MLWMAIWIGRVGRGAALAASTAPARTGRPREMDLADMKFLVVGSGMALAVCGAASIWLGYDIVQMERGWTQVIAGATALTGGIITMSIGMLIASVDNLRGALTSQTSRSPHAAPGSSDEPVGAVAKDDADNAVAPAPAARTRQGETESAAGPGKNPASPKGVASDALSHVATGDLDPALQWLRSGRGRTSHGSGEPAAVASKPRPEVARRYEANGASYTLYIDGSIDSESPDGRFHFTDMSELKSHLARQSLAKSLFAPSAPPSDMRT